MSEQAELDAPAASEVHPIDAAIKAAKDGWAKESDKAKSNGQKPSLPVEEHADAGVEDKAEGKENAPVSGGETSDKDKADTAPDAEGSPDLSWLPDEFKTPQSRQSKKFAEWLKQKVNAADKFTQKMQGLAKDRDTFQRDVEVGQSIREKRPDIADVAYRMSKGESIHDIAASMKGEDKAKAFDYAGSTSEEIEKHIEEVSDRRQKARAEAELKAQSVSESDEVAVRTAIVEFVNDNGIDPKDAFAAIQAASDAIRAGDEIPWTVEKAGKILKKYLKPAKASTETGNTRNGKSDESGLSKVASPIGLGVGARSRPADLSAEAKKRWASGDVTDEERLRIFNRIPSSYRRGQGDGAAGE